MTKFSSLTQKKKLNDIDWPKLKNLMSFIYIDLLEAIAAGDRDQINAICQANLYQAFSEGLDELN